jgi:hypothetical protein
VTFRKRRQARGAANAAPLFEARVQDLAHGYQTPLLQLSDTMVIARFGQSGRRVFPLKTARDANKLQDLLSIAIEVSTLL